MHPTHATTIVALMSLLGSLTLKFVKKEDIIHRVAFTTPPKKTPTRNKGAMCSFRKEKKTLFFRSSSSSSSSVVYVVAAEFIISGI